jgi:hypothetical protein
MLDLVALQEQITRYIDRSFLKQQTTTVSDAMHELRKETWMFNYTGDDGSGDRWVEQHVEERQGIRFEDTAICCTKRMNPRKTGVTATRKGGSEFRKAFFSIIK